jgi:hypothetical protein
MAILRRIAAHIDDVNILEYISSTMLDMGVGWGPTGGSLTETISSQSHASRAVPGKDFAGKKVHEEDMPPRNEDDEEDVVCTRRQE